MTSWRARSTWIISGCLSLIVVIPSTALAWGPSAHRIVAELAEQDLDARSLLEIRKLLELSGANSLADIANWADEVRSDPAQRELSRATSRLHFVNFTDSRCHYDPASICARGQCVVAAIDHYAQVLGERTTSDAERAEALRFLVHFVADAHQPLHAGYRSDRGGNNFQVRIGGKGSNLHAIWDSRILASRRLGWQAYARQLSRQSVADSSGNPVLWVEQSCRITREEPVYPERNEIDRAYLARMRPLAERQLRIAARRLATLLNRVLG